MAPHDLDLPVHPVQRFWTVTPLELGRRLAPASWFRYLDTTVEPVEIAYRCWLLRSVTGSILVDTGPPPAEARDRGIEGVESVEIRLAELNLAPESISDVVLTHLHWDHAASLSLFGNAQVHVQHSELEFFRGRAWDHPATSRFYSRQAALAAMLDSERVVAVYGDAQPWPGITLLRVGGHTPGSQMVCVETPRGLAVIAGDAIPLIRNFTEDVPTGILVNLAEVFDARRRLRELDPALLYTGHDPLPTLLCRQPTEGSGPAINSSDMDLTCSGRH